MSDQHDKYILKNDTTYTVIDCKTKPIGSCSSGNMNTGPNTGPDQCPDNIKSKLGRGCHACGGGNKYWFDDNHEKYILRSDTANTVFDCKTKPVGSCTGGNINTGPIDTDCPDAVKNRLGSSCHECTKGVYMNNDHDKYILKNDPKYTVVDCKTKPIGSCSNTKYDYKKDDYKKDDYKKDDYKKDDYKKKDYSSNPCKTDSRYSKSDDGYYYMKSPKYDGNFTDNMYRGPFDENCKPVSKTTPPLKTVPPTKKKDTFNCPTIYKPVCAITKEGNKKTFNNNCQAKNYGAKIIDFYNSCEYKKDKFNNKDDGYYTKDGTRCIDDYKPVCTIMPDGNKKTQDNACKAKAMNLKIVDFYRGCEYKAYDYSKDKKYDDKGNYDYKRDFKRHKEGPDYDYRKDSNWNYDDKGKDFKKFDKNRKEDEKKGLSRWIRDTKRMIKDMSRWDKGKGPGPGGPGFGPAPVKVEMPKKAKSILAKMEAKLKSAEDYYKKGEYEKARDALEDIQDLRDDFEDAMDELHDKLEIEMIKREVKFAEKEMKKVKEKLQPSFKNYKVCMGYADEGLSLIAKVKAALDKKDWDTLDDLKYKKFELEDKVFRDCKSVYNNKADIKSFNEVYIDQKNRGMSQNIIDQISEEVAKKVLANIKSHSNIVNQIFENVTDKSLTKEIAKTFEVAQVIPKKYQQDFFSQKAAILKEIKEMEGLRKKLKEAKTLAMKELNELKAVQDEIATYNFVGSAGTEIKDEVSKFVASADKLSKTEVKAKIVELKQKAKQKITKARYDKFSKGIIGFLDADDNEWFGKYALQAKQLGYVKGTGESGETKLNPGGKTNVAEAVAMFGRVLGEESTGIVLTTIDLPTWAHGGAAALQKKGVNLDKLFNGKKASDKVTRAETAQLLKEVYKLSSGDNSKFPDINKVASDKKEAIGAVNAAGIMTGEGNGNFNPNAPLNRAAMTKVLIKANEQAKVLTK